MFLSCVPFGSVVIGHINGGWLCFGWTGGFLASLHTGEVEGASLFYVCFFMNERLPDGKHWS